MPPSCRSLLLTCRRVARLLSDGGWSALVPRAGIAGEWSGRAGFVRMVSRGTNVSGGHFFSFKYLMQSSATFSSSTTIASMLFPIAIVVAAWYFFRAGLQISMIRPCTPEKRRDKFCRRDGARARQAGRAEGAEGVSHLECLLGFLLALRIFLLRLVR